MAQRNTAPDSADFNPLTTGYDPRDDNVGVGGEATTMSVTADSEEVDMKASGRNTDTHNKHLRYGSLDGFAPRIT